MYFQNLKTQYYTEKYSEFIQNLGFAWFYFEALL